MNIVSCAKIGIKVISGEIFRQGCLFKIFFTHIGNRVDERAKG